MTDITPGEIFTAAYSWDYAVFRCPPARTTEFEETLREQGWKIFTPQHWVHRRMPRRKRKVWEVRALIPSFLFLEIAHQPELAIKLKNSGIVGLTPMIDRGKIVCFSREEFEALLELDTRSQKPFVNTLEPESAKFSPGDLVAPNGTGAVELLEILFQGGSGKVLKENSSGELFVAIKNSPRPVWISGLLLYRLPT